MRGPLLEWLEGVLWADLCTRVEVLPPGEEIRVELSTTPGWLRLIHLNDGRWQVALPGGEPRYCDITEVLAAIRAGALPTSPAN